MSRLDQLKAQGFDRSIRAGRVGLESIHVACSQCQAAVINGLPCHESGCPAATHACLACDAQIPTRQRYCSEECSA